MSKVELSDAELIHALEKELPSPDPDDARWANLNADLMYQAAKRLTARNAELAELRKVVERVEGLCASAETAPRRYIHHSELREALAAASAHGKP